MTFDPNAGMEQDEVNEIVDEAIEENEVVLFMKGTPVMPQCGYSKRALGLITQYRQDVETVDTLESLEEFRTALDEHSGWETIPQTYVDGEFVGGSDILAELEERGELAETLNVEDVDVADADVADAESAGDAGEGSDADSLDAPF